MNAHVLDSSVEFFDRPFIKPLKLSSGTITQITEARAMVRVRVEGRETTGRGTIYLSDLWAWPDPSLDHAIRDRALGELSKFISANLVELCGGDPHHPLELGLRLHESVCDAGRSDVRISPSPGTPGEGWGGGLSGDATARTPSLALPPRDLRGNWSTGGGEVSVGTILARAMCASPFDAAIHDAVGIALNRSAFDLYAQDFALPSADRFFETGSASSAIRALLQPPRNTLDAWLIVGPDDDLGASFAATVKKHGYRCFKLKIRGKDNGKDVAQTIAVFRAAQAAGASSVKLSVDSNEANPDAASVLDYLRHLKSEDGDAFKALVYLEQPTARDIEAHDFDWHEVTKLKPVMLDEGLTSLDLLAHARRRGWSGLALKTCKGHSFALVAAAWAKQNGMLLSMQDLTNPGLAAIHAALFAARIGTINGVELNANQFTPAANEEWLPRLSDLFEPRDGVHRLNQPNVVGLGSIL